MKKIYQTNKTSDKGNCMQAAYATLFQLKLKDVPNFILKKSWFQSVLDFYKEHGYQYVRSVRNPNLFDVFKDSMPEGLIKPKDNMNQIHIFDGINSLYAAVVYSPKYWKRENNAANVTHQVLIDKNFNIIHDPNSDYINIKYPLADEIGYNGIISVEFVKLITK